ncbi:hypothetical protein GHO25_25615, partial [Pseudomonas sp. FSL R10-1350]|nr:hypothetical protein [Pseudomonas sp. FSL R10-1350]
HEVNELMLIGGAQLYTQGLADADRLSDWHHALEKLGLPFATSAPINWLETGHD